jgi:D-3-phosphoglycerate dehydrogenase
LPLIYSTHRLHPRAATALDGIGELKVASALDAGTLVREGRQADVVIVRANLPEAMFDEAPRLRAAIRHGAGLDMIPVEAATRAGVLVANVPAVNAPSVAEHVFFVTLALLRRFRMVDRDLRQQGWLAGRQHADNTLELAGRTLGVIGAGNVGNAVMTIARGFGLSVIANSRNPKSLPDDVRFVSVDELVAEADIVVLSCPLTSETTGLLSRERIRRMRPGALLVNVSRGAVVDDTGLVEALRQGRIGGAALDVFREQPLPPGHPYFSFDNVIITPHMAGITDESMMRMGLGAAEETIRVLSNNLPVNLRNPHVLATYRRRFPAAA